MDLISFLYFLESGFTPKASNTHLHCRTPSLFLFCFLSIAQISYDFTNGSFLFFTNYTPASSLIYLISEKDSKAIWWSGHWGSTWLLCWLLHKATLYFCVLHTCFYGTEDAQALQAKESGKIISFGGLLFSDQAIKIYNFYMLLP